MRTRLRHPSPAMVVALIALFVAMGGTGYAAATGSIDGREIKNSTIQSKDVKNSSLTGTDVKNNSLTGSDITESKLGKVPSAGTADTASTANTAGSAGNGVKAYGTVTSTGAVIGAESKGIIVTKLSPDGAGKYCVTAPGVSSAAHPIIVTPDHTDGNGIDHTAEYVSASNACKDAGGWRIFTLNNGAFTDIRFSVIIP